MATKLTHRSKLIDELGNLKAQIAFHKKKEKELVALLNARIGTFEGQVYKITVYHVAPMLLDQAKVKAILTETQYQSCLSPGEAHNTVRCSKK